MALVQIRNPDMAHNRTVIAGEAMKSGMIVKLVAAATKGDPCKVMKASGTDLADATIMKGVVTHIQDNDLAVDFILNPVNSSLTLNTGDDNTLDIPAGTLVVFWYNKPVLGVHSAAVDASLDFATVREGAKVAVKEGTAKLGLYNSADATLDVFLGTVYQHEGVELTILLSAL